MMPKGGRWRRTAADIYPELVKRGVIPDLVTEQTAAHDPLVGYVPQGLSLAEAGPRGDDRRRHEGRRGDTGGAQGGSAGSLTGSAANEQRQEPECGDHRTTTVGASTRSSISSTCPSRMWTTRSHAAATSGSWVTTRSAASA